MIKTLTAIPDKRVFETTGYSIKEDWENNTIHRLHVVFNFPMSSKDGKDLLKYCHKKNQVFIFQNQKEAYVVHRLSIHIIPSNKYMVGKFNVINGIEACEILNDA